MTDDAKRAAEVYAVTDDWVHDNGSLQKGFLAGAKWAREQDERIKELEAEVLELKNNLKDAEFESFDQGDL